MVGGRHVGWRRTMIAGVGTALLIGLGSSVVPTVALAKPVLPPKACQVLEALVSDEVSGPDPAAGEVIRFAGSTSQSTLTNNWAPIGGPSLDSPEDMAFDLNGDIVTVDMGITTGISQVVRVDKDSGVRSVIAGTGVGSGPVVDGPYSTAVETNGTILVLDFDSPTSTARRLLQITPSGTRAVLSSGSVGSGAAFGTPQQVRVVNGTIYCCPAPRSCRSIR